MYDDMGAYFDDEAEGEGSAQHSQFVQARRCGACDLNWPDYRALRCGRCGGNTWAATVLPHKVLTPSEVAHIRFEKWLQGESEGDRKTREDTQRAKEQARQDRLARFDEVIQGAGFTPDERREIRDIETKLGVTMIIEDEE